jgi:DNA polymerase (family 10)
MLKTKIPALLAATDTQGTEPAPAVPVRLPLDRARKLAETIVAALQPDCARIEIAGSIRRGLAMVGDIDLVILPKNRTAIVERIRKGCRTITNGPQNLITEWKLGDGTPFQLDIFFARPASRDLFKPIPSNWGTLLVCRTGSKQFNIYLAEKAKGLGLKWDPYEGLFKGDTLIPCEEEGDLFRELMFKEWIKPEDRER